MKPNQTWLACNVHRQPSEPVVFRRHCDDLMLVRRLTAGGLARRRQRSSFMGNAVEAANDFAINYFPIYYYVDRFLNTRLNLLSLTT